MVGTIHHDGGDQIMQSGFCWNTTGSPSLNDSVENTSSTNGVILFTPTNLLPITQYYFRTYATNSVGTSYGNIISFTTGYPWQCGGTAIDVDSNSYSSVQIGYQCWLTENMKVTHYPDGTPIPHITGDANWGNLQSNNTDDGYCFYDDISSNIEVYGLLYTWAAAMGDNAIESNQVPSGVQGICPAGWHIPSDDEWKILELELGMSQVDINEDGYRGTDQGSQLAGNASLWSNGNLEQNPSFGSTGFNALPSGRRSSSNGYSDYEGIIGFWWTSSLDYGATVWTRSIRHSFAGNLRNESGKSYGVSVRCLRNPVAPVVQTNSQLTFTDTLAEVSGEVIVNGGATVLSRGFCWNTTGNPNFNNDYIESGQGLGLFSALLTGLIPGETYYFKAYATNLAGTLYGDEIQFTTLYGLPVIQTISIDSISYTTANITSQVIDNGVSPVISRGVCYNAFGNPTINGNHTIDGLGSGFFSSEISNLSLQITYYVRAYATNSVGTNYGDELQLTTINGLPVVQTNVVSDITDSSATLNGELLSFGYGTFINKGFCYNTIGYPTLNDNFTSEGQGIGQFNSNISGLLIGMTYYVRAYATNSTGTKYGAVTTFATLNAVRII